MFNKIKKAVKSVAQKVKANVQMVETATEMAKFQLTARATMAVAGTAAESYVDTGVKILIAVVIGALLLAGLYALFNSTIMPKVTEKVEGLFNYAG